MAESIDAEQANRVLTLIADSLEQGKEFVMEQAPDLVQQLILWKRAELTTYFALAVVGLVVSAVLIRPAIRGWYAVEEEDSGENITKAIAYTGLAILGTIFGIAGVCTNIVPMLQVWLAPKVYLLEYCARLAS